MKDRIRLLRKISRLSRNNIQRMSNDTIKASNLGNMEDGSSKPSFDMLLNLINFFEGFGIFIDYQWLLKGVGNKPYLINDLSNNLNTNIHSINEIDFFKKNNPNSIIIHATDNDLTPRFNVGDILGAICTQERIFLNDYIFIPDFNNTVYKIFSDEKKKIHVLYKNHTDIEEIIEFNKLPKTYHIVWWRKNNL